MKMTNEQLAELLLKTNDIKKLEYKSTSSGWVSPITENWTWEDILNLIVKYNWEFRVKEQVDKQYIITDRQICNLIELNSRVIKQISLIKVGDNNVNGKDRMDIVVDCCEKTYKVLSSLGPKEN